MSYSIHITCVPCLPKICPVDTMFINHLLDYDLGVEIFFKKEGATEKGEVDYEIHKD